MAICNQAINADPIVQQLLDKTEHMTDDLDGIIDLTLETIIRVRDEQKNSETTARKYTKNEGRSYIPIYSAGLRKERAIYSYLRYNLKEQFYDKKKMLIEQLWLGLPGLTGGSDTDNLCARPNFGTIPVPSIFQGVEYGVFEDIMPWISQCATKAEVMKFIDQFDPDKVKDSGAFPIALDHTAFFRDRLAGLDIYIGDVNNQGMFDIAHMVRGAEIFFDLYDDPDFVHELMKISTEAYIAAFNAIEEAAGRTDRTSASYSDDSSILISMEQFAEFSLPYLHQLADHYESIPIHFCGNGPHLQSYLACPKVSAINFGQPQFYNYEQVMGEIIGAGKQYAGLWPATAEEKTAESYFRRMLKPVQGNENALAFSIYGYEFGMNSADLCKLWYDLQDEMR